MKYSILVLKQADRIVKAEDAWCMPNVGTG